LFPTSIRNSGLGSCSLVARLGGVLANAVGDLAEIHVNLPIAMFGSAAVISSIISVLLPETAGKPLANTVAECQLYESKTRGLGHLEKNSEKCPAAITIEKEKGISTNVNLSNISLTNGNEIKA